jgi:hypothetical protein
MIFPRKRRLGFLESSDVKEDRTPSKYLIEVRGQVLQPAGAGSKPRDLAEAFGMTQATV